MTGWLVTAAAAATVAAVAVWAVRERLRAAAVVLARLLAGPPVPPPPPLSTRINGTGSMIWAEEFPTLAAMPGTGRHERKPDVMTEGIPQWSATPPAEPPQALGPPPPAAAPTPGAAAEPPHFDPGKDVNLAAALRESLAAAAPPPPVLFFDAVTLAHYPHGQPGCFYGDGEFATTPAAVGAMVNPPEARWITVTGNPDVGSIVDGRPDNFLSPGRMRAFVRGRRAINTDAIIYAPRAWVAEWLFVLNDFGHGELGKYGRLFWWIPTLDGHQWTAAELSADLADNWQAEVPADRIWGNQWNQLPALGPGATVDVSSLFLPWRPNG